jgi:hypothetical protein
MNAWRHAAPLLAMGFVAASGCALGSTNAESAAAPGLADNASSSGGNGGGGASSAPALGDDAGSGVAALPPEMHAENKFKAPVATGNFVWSANPTSGRVAYINAATFNVQTTPAGNGPTYLAAVTDAQHPNDDVAIVLNVLSQDATLLRVNAQGTLTTQTYPSTSDANSWAISASGHWGIAWTDATFVDNPDPTQGFQFLAVMDLSATTTGLHPAPSTILAVGYRPVEVAFSSDDSRAYAVSVDGVSVIDLKSGTPTVIRQDSLPVISSPSTPDAGIDDASADAASADASADAASADASGNDGAGNTPVRSSNGGDAGPGATSVGSGAPQVSFTPDGAYALARRDGMASITIDALADGTQTTVPLPSAPTDLTVSPAGDFAVAVLRDTSNVVLLPIPGTVGNPGAISTIPVAGPTVGRALVTNQGKSVVLFTTVAPVMSITVLDLGASPAARVLPLHAPVQAVFPSNDGQYAIVLHQITPTPGSMVQGAFSVVPIGQPLPAVIESLQAPPTAVAVTNDRAIVSIRDDTSSTFGLYMALMPSLDIHTYTLASPPTAVGIAAGAGRGYAAQDYSEGRITFVDLSEKGPPDSGTGFGAITITGFELNAGIVVGGSGQ